MIDFGRIEGFDWDGGNGRKNLDKHGVTQLEAEQAFRHRPALVEHAIDQQLAAEWVEARRTMCHESLPTVRCFDNTPYRAKRLSLVNNVSGNYS